MKRLDQSGSHLVLAAMGVLLIAVVAFAGYRVTHNTQSTDISTPVSATTKAPATINSKADLNATAKSLDDTSSQVDSSVNGDALNSDLSALN